MFENALSPFAFPSLLKMETEFISMVSGLFGGDAETVGSMTSGVPKASSWLSNPRGNGESKQTGG